MTIPNLTSDHLQQLLELLRQKETLLLELVAVEREMEAIYNGRTPGTGRKVGRPSKKEAAARQAPMGGGKRPRLKDMILERLRSVGPGGIKVKDLADDLGVGRKNVEIWFSTTGKTIAGIKKMGPGLFGMSGTGGGDARASGEPKGRKPGRRRRARGSTKEKIVAALKAAGDDGVSVKELSAELGVKVQNLHTWFNQTGKKMPEIKKVSPGKYRIAA